MRMYSCLIDLSSSALPHSRAIRSSGFNVPDWPDLHIRHMLDGDYHYSRHCRLHLH